MLRRHCRSGCRGASRFGTEFRALSWRRQDAALAGCSLDGLNIVHRLTKVKGRLIFTGSVGGRLDFWRCSHYIAHSRLRTELPASRRSEARSADLRLKVPEVSKKGKRETEYSRRKRAGQRLIQLWVSADRYSQLQTAAASVEEPVTAWIRRAVFGALRKWEVPALDKQAFEACSICGKRHDRNEHFPDNAGDKLDRLSR
jgi:hypothetical protein